MGLFAYSAELSFVVLVIYIISYLFTGIYSLLSSVGYWSVTLWIGWNIVKIYKRFAPRYVPQHVTDPRVDPAGRAVLVTGCDTGFGNEIARQLAAREFRVFAACLNPDADGAKELDEETGDNLSIIKLNVTSDSDVEDAVKTVKDQLKGKTFWGLVNNAGLGCWHAMESGSAGVEELYRPTIEVNLLGTIRVTKAFLPLLRKTPGSRVVLVASAAGRFSFPNLVPYSVSKFGVRAFGDGLRREMAPFGLKVSIIEPGMYRTPINDYDKVVSDWERRFDLIPAESRSQYSSEHRRDLLGALTGLLEAQRPQVGEVVADIRHALETANEPHLYYRPTGYLAALTFYFIELFPDEIQDSLLSIRMVQLFGNVLTKLQW